MKSRPLTDEEKKIIDELTAENIPQMQIADRINRSQSTVSFYLRNNAAYINKVSEKTRGQAAAQARKEYSIEKRIVLNNRAYAVLEKWLKHAQSLNPKDLPTDKFAKMMSAYEKIEAIRNVLDPIVSGDGQKSGLEEMRESLRQKPAENKDSEEEQNNELASVPA